MPKEDEIMLHAELLLCKWICVLLEHLLFTDVNVKTEIGVLLVYPDT